MHAGLIQDIDEMIVIKEMVQFYYVWMVEEALHFQLLAEFGYIIWCE